MELTSPGKMAAPYRVKRWLPAVRNIYWSWRRQFSRSCCCHQDVEKIAPPSSMGSISQMPYYITTPIFYVNAAPHIGHLYSVLLADVAARWQRLKGATVRFSVGTDEHGLKIKQAAENAGFGPADYCDRVSAQFKAVFDQMGISYDSFVRTTQPSHYEAVQAFWERLSQRGHIYKGSYEGWYCVSDEAFLTDNEVTEAITADGHKTTVSVTSGQPVMWTKEENYMFRLTAFQEQLTSWLDSTVVQPSQFESLVRGWLADLRDLSVSRQRQRLTWGIPVPGDDSQTVYVWLDALVNYLTVAGFPHTMTYDLWPPTCQVIGKDILRFHAVYWPAFLMAADLPPPRMLLCHSHWTVDGHKMSKSRGNVVDPVHCSGRFTPDGLRYFLLKEGSLSNDSNYSEIRAAERINADLVNSLGNLLSRVTAPSVNKQQEFPPMSLLPQSTTEGEDVRQFLSESDLKMYFSLHSLPEQADDLYQAFAFSRLLDLLMGHVHWANALVQTHRPWDLVKAEGDMKSQHHLRVVLHVAMETLHVCGVLLQPVVPGLADRLLTRLGVAPEGRGLGDLIDSSRQRPLRRPLGEKVILLDRIHTEK